MICGQTLEFRRFSDESALKSDPKYNIPQPTSDERLNAQDSDTVILVPGIAFTANGARLGRGGGYYDRILSELKNAHKIGIALQCQKVAQLPTDKHDINMNEVLFG